MHNAVPQMPPRAPPVCQALLRATDRPPSAPRSHARVGRAAVSRRTTNGQLKAASRARRKKKMCYRDRARTDLGEDLREETTSEFRSEWGAGRASRVRAGGNSICASEGWAQGHWGLQCGQKDGSPEDPGPLRLSPWVGCGADYGGGEYWGDNFESYRIGGPQLGRRWGRRTVLLLEFSSALISLVHLISVCRSVIGNYPNM